MDDDDFGADSELISALASSGGGGAARQDKPPPANRIQQPKPQKIQQPTPQRLDKAPPTNNSGPKIVQPTPQALPQRSAGSSILVSPRQKGNPVLAALRSVGWEYSDIPADYGLGATTCALFLSLKYHRLHPEYIYTRIRNLEGRYNLRIVLTMVDIPNHEDSLRELSKTSLVNNVTIILCWSAAEAARYLELYKSYEHANFSGIKGQQATSYSEKLVEFVTVPRGINKADAVSLVSAFGSIRNAVNADAEQVSIIGGWGEKKVKRWLSVVEEPFRVQHAAKRRLVTSESSNAVNQAMPISRVPLRDMPGLSTAASRDSEVVEAREPARGKASQYQIRDPAADEDDDDLDDDAMLAAAIEESKRTAAVEEASSSSRQEDKLSEGIAAALAKLRDKA